MRRTHALFAAVLALAVLAVATDYTPAAGSHKVSVVDEMVLHDAARKKDVKIKIYYPDGAGPFPVIVFSHGAFGSKDSYFGLGEYWASHGYVSIHPSHADSMKDSGYRGGLRKVLDDSSLWQSRPKDISFALDSLDEIERRAPQLKGKLDRDRIGVGGHSYGAYTAEAVGGATITLPGSTSPLSLADPRVKAVVVMSPQGEGEMGLTAKSWENIRRPMLCMYGSRDFGSQRRTPTWRSQPFFASPPGDKYDMELQGATHFTFVGPMRAGMRESPLFEYAKMEALAFWDAYLKGSADAKQYLKSKALEKQSNGAARIDVK